MRSLNTSVVVNGWPLLKSQLKGVSDEAWTKFIGVLSTTPDGNGTLVPRPLNFHGAMGLGAFALKPLRLADLGIMRNVRRIGPAYDGEFILPFTREKFLADHFAQHAALVRSLRRYDMTLVRPIDMSRAGALVLLHCAGPGGIASWGKRKLPATVDLVRRADCIF